MLRHLGDLYAWLFGWPVLARVHKGLFYLSARALGLYNFTSPHITGERHTIALGIAGKDDPVVFDVGANGGDWTAEVLAGVRPNARVQWLRTQAPLGRRHREGLSPSHREQHRPR